MASDAENLPEAPGPLALVCQVEAVLAGLGRTFDAQGLQALRSLVARCPEIGGEGAGEVAASLFMLLERLIAGGRFDREALAVHIRAWRLMTTSEPDAASRAALLSGLKQVRDLYAEAQAA